MTIQELPEKTVVNLDIIWGERTFTLNSEVIGSNENSVLIRPFIYNGVIINLPEEKRRDLSFDLYVVDPNTGTRKAWKDIQVKAVKYQGRTYYACSISTFKKLAIDDDRRHDIRIPLDLAGTVEFTNGASVSVNVKDISDGGVGFWVPADYELPTLDGTLRFHDNVRDKNFEMAVKFKKVRSEKHGADKLIGARTYSITHDILAYVCIKRMDMHNPENLYEK